MAEQSQPMHIGDIDGLPTRISVSYVPNAAEHILLTVIHTGTPIPYAEVFVVGRAGAVRSIGRSEPFGKDDSAESVAYRDGTVRLIVSEAQPYQGGGTSRLRIYDFHKAIPGW